MAQGLRPSQYITTFGPGSLIETPSGPYVLCSTDDVLARISDSGIDMDDLEIRDVRLQRGLLGGAKIFKIPDSASWKNFSYPTVRFPTWNLCVQHDNLNFNVIHKAYEGCPRCAPSDREKSKDGKYAIRFLLVCPNGHMDDIDWRFVVHRSERSAESPTCRTRHFHWIGSGSSLSSIRIVCPDCSAEKTLGDIYQMRMTCFGKRIENRNAPQEGCGSEEAVVVQRGAFQVRLANVVTSLAIPPLVEPIHRFLQNRRVLGPLQSIRDAIGSLSEDMYRNAIRGLVERHEISHDDSELSNHTVWSEIQEAMGQISSASVPRTPSEYLAQEHRSMMDVITTGFPPYPPDNERRRDEPIKFKVDGATIRRDVQGPGGNMIFRVMPIDRLCVVLAQTGYRRVDYVNGPESSSMGSTPHNIQERWIPGVEQFGEGIYIDLNPEIGTQANWVPTGPTSTNWDAELPHEQDDTELIPWNSHSVWWHSLSHRLINAMSLHSGYSSTAIRERIYFTETEPGIWRGGILLYTTQAGGDGTMGGLTSLVPDFERIFEMALENIDRCSNDPLCEEAELDEVSHLGAACYSCQMVSETSCEHFNGHLHRGLLLENQP